MYRVTGKANITIASGVTELVVDSFQPIAICGYEGQRQGEAVLHCFNDFFEVEAVEKTCQLIGDRFLPQFLTKEFRVGDVIDDGNNAANLTVFVYNRLLDDLKIFGPFIITFFDDVIGALPRLDDHAVVFLCDDGVLTILSNIEVGQSPNRLVRLPEMVPPLGAEDITAFDVLNVYLGRQCFEHVGKIVETH